MSVFKRGDYVKFEIRQEGTGECEWVWLKVNCADERTRVVFGTFESVPIIRTDLNLGQRLAVSYDNITRHAKRQEFELGQARRVQRSRP